jgi:chromosome partitioning protein
MGQIITIAQQKGGAGKTTVAAHLAIALAQAGLLVSLLDVDPQASLSSWFAARKKFTAKGEEKLHISCNSYTDRWGLGHTIQRIKDDADVLIIDTPPHTKEQARVCIAEADLVILPLQPSPCDLWASMNTIQMVNEENTETFVILNRVINNTRLATMFMSELPRKRFNTVLANRVAYAASMVEGKGVTEDMWAHTAAGQEIYSLTKEVAEAMPQIIKSKKRYKELANA